MIDRSRRHVLKLSLVLGGGVALGVGAYELASLLPKSNGDGSQTTAETSIQTTESSTETTIASTTVQNRPFAAKDLQQEITPLFNDLQAFGDGITDPYSLEAGSDVYTKLTANAENLRKAIANYRPQNSETMGQVRRLDQIALGALNLYSMTSRVLEDDVGAPSRSSISQNLRVVRYPLSELRNLLDAEVNPDETYVQNSGKFSTDIATEYLIAPRFRPGFKALYDSLEASSKARLKQLFESQGSPTAEAITDYKKVTEEQLAIAYLNNDLLWMDQDNQKYMQTVIENGTKRNSSLGEITSRTRTMIEERNAASQNPYPLTLKDGYAQYIDSVYSELPSNHTELNDYDFAMAAMKTPSLVALRHQLIDVQHADYHYGNDTLVISSRVFHNVAALADRDSYVVVSSPEGSNINISCAENNGKFYSMEFNTNPPRLDDISNKNFGYGGFRKSKFFIVSKPSFGTINVIPIFVYNPQKGIVDLW
jgi:hypothetical protein